ncbi:MAG TPA: TolC family protein, partial [Verrucomicrobiae bacterium]|nr:TolC family protein [Verrucomicrobiae bacterium]
MKHRLYISAALSCALLAAGAAAHAQPLSLTLPEAIRLSAERNLDVRAQLYSPAIAEAEVRRA